MDFVKKLTKYLKKELESRNYVVNLSENTEKVYFFGSEIVGNIANISFNPEELLKLKSNIIKEEFIEQSGKYFAQHEYQHWNSRFQIFNSIEFNDFSPEEKNLMLEDSHGHTYFSYNNNNFGTRINQDKFDQISIWLNEDSVNPLPDLRDSGVEYSGFSPYQLSLDYSTIDIFCYVENVGFTSVGTFEVSYYLSPDSTVTVNDHLLGTDVITSLGVDSNTESAWSGPLPVSIPDGNYYVGWIIDPSNNIDEFNEDNNKQIIETKTVVVDTTAPSSSIFYTPKSGTNKIDKTTIFSIDAGDIFGSGIFTPHLSHLLFACFNRFSLFSLHFLVLLIF